MLKKLLGSLALLLLLPTVAFAQFTTHQGGTGLSDVAAGSIPFGSVFNLREATSSAFQFNNSASRLTVTNASTTVLSATTLCLIGDVCRTTWPSGGSSASSTLLGDTNTFSGTDTFSNTIGGSISGNASTATTLQNARTINGVSFNGSANIVVASTTLLGDTNTFSGTDIFSNTLKVASLSGFIGGNGGTLYNFATSTIKTSQLTNDAGFLTSAVTSVGATYPISSSGGATPTISTAFGTTSNTGIAAGSLYIGSGGIFQSTATTTASCTGNATCTAFTVFGASPVTINVAAGTAASSTLLTDANTFSGVDKFTNASSDFSGTWQTFSPAHFLTAAITALGPTGQTQTGATQTLATSSATTISGLTVGLTIVGNTNTQTFTPTFTGSISGLTTSNFSSANISQWTNNSNYITLASHSGTYPITYNSGTGAIGFSGLATTSPWTQGQLAYVVNNNTITSTPTTTVTCTGSASCTSFVALGSSPVSINVAAGTAASSTLLGDTNTFSGTDSFTHNITTTGINGAAGSALTISPASGRTLTLQNNGGTGAFDVFDSGVIAVVPATSVGFEIQDPNTNDAIFDTNHLSANRTFAFPNVTGTFGIGVSTTSGQLAYWGGDAGLRSAATTSVTCTGNATCTSFAALGSSPVTINVAAGTAASSTLLGDTNTFSGTDIFSNTIKVASLAGFIGGNSGTLYGFATSTIKTSQLTNDAGFLTSAVTGVSATYPLSSSGGNTPTITTGFSTTTNNGMPAGNLYVGSGGIWQSAASSSIFGYTPLNPTRQLTINGTANQITSSAGAQDLSADRTWTFSLPAHVKFPTDFEASAGSTTNATTTGSQYFTGITASRPLYVDSTGLLTSAGSGVSGNCVNWGANNTLGDAGAACGSGGGGATFGKTFEINSANLLAPTTTLGITVAASTGYYINNNLLGYASSTNQATLFGLGAGGKAATTSAAALDTAAFGYFAGNALNAGGLDNTAVGQEALMTATSSDQNTALGSFALWQQNGFNNTGIGYDTLGESTGYLANRNTAVGANAFSSIATGSENVAVGDTAGSNAVSASRTVAIGASSLNGSATLVTGTVAVGYAAGANIGTSGDYNVLLGYQAGNGISTGYGNTLLGPNVNNVTTVTSGANNIGLGYNTLFPSASASNQLNIGNFIYGSIPATTSVTAFKLPTSGALGVGTSSPFAKFAIQTNNGDTATTLFAIGSSTQSATTTLFSIDNTGLITTQLATGFVQSSSGVLSSAALTSGQVTTALGFTPISGNQTITLSGVVTGSGATSIVTSFGSQSAGVLGNSITGNTAPMATSTLYGAVQLGKVLAGANNAIQWVATTTDSCSTGITCAFSAGNNAFSIANGAISNAMLANSAISGVALGSNLNSLSTNSSLTGTSYNGSAAVSNWGINLANSNIFTVGQMFLGSTTIGGGTQTTGLTISGGATTTGNFTVKGTTAATSTMYLKSTDATKGGRIILEDVAGGTCTEVTALAGVLSAKVVACP